MILKSDSWVLVTGKAGYGKTVFIREHIRKIPMSRLYILDYNVNDYQDFLKTAHIWNNQTGSMSEIDEFMKIVYRRGNVFCVLEESDNYLFQPSEFGRRFVNTARNRGVGAFVNAKRPMGIKPIFRTRFSHIVVFHIDLSEDIEYIEKWAAVEPGTLEKLRNLKIGEHIIINLLDSTISDVQRLKL